MVTTPLAQEPVYDLGDHPIAGVDGKKCPQGRSCNLNRVILPARKNVNPAAPVDHLLVCYRLLLETLKRLARLRVLTDLVVGKRHKRL
ncbi:hypothetical protein ES703_93159 [subsurface metagenome]